MVFMQFTLQQHVVELLIGCLLMTGTLSLEERANFSKITRGTGRDQMHTLKEKSQEKKVLEKKVLGAHYFNVTQSGHEGKVVDL